MLAPYLTEVMAAWARQCMQVPVPQSICRSWLFGQGAIPSKPCQEPPPYSPHFLLGSTPPNFLQVSEVSEVSRVSGVQPTPVLGLR